MNSSTKIAIALAILMGFASFRPRLSNQANVRPGGRCSAGPARRGNVRLASRRQSASFLKRFARTRLSL
jgi:hypothetical protein